MFEDFRLRVFDTVARCGSFTAAARELGISQPAVSQNIAELEKTLGVTLFERTRTSVSLTGKGVLFRRYCDQILYWYDAAEKAVAGADDAAPAPVVLPLDESTDVEISVSPLGISLRKI